MSRPTGPFALYGYMRAMVFNRPFRSILASAACGWLLVTQPALADPVGPLALPPEASWGEMAVDGLVATAASAAVLGLAVADGGRGPLGSAGAVGQFALIAGVTALPPGALVTVSSRPYPIESYVAALSGGLAGLAIGFASTRQLGWPAPGPNEAMIQVAAMAVCQGLASTAVHHLYQRHRPLAEDLNRLPPDAERTDDPIDDWNLRREREQR